MNNKQLITSKKKGELEFVSPQIIEKIRTKKLKKIIEILLVIIDLK